MPAQRLLASLFICAEALAFGVAQSAPTWTWPLDPATSAVFLRPGNRANPVFGNVFQNPNYFLAGKEGDEVHSPVDGVVVYLFDYMLVHPDAMHSWTWKTHDDFLESSKENSLFKDKYLTRSISIRYRGGTVHLRGFSSIRVKQGEKVVKGQVIGELGYLRTFSDLPCLCISASTASGGCDLDLGLYLLGQDDSAQYAEMSSASIAYKPDEALARDQARKAWGIFRRAIEEDHPALLDPRIKEKSGATFQRIENGIGGNITARELREKLREASASLDCSHTKIRVMDQSFYETRMPLALVLHEGRCYVLWDRRGKGEVPAGAEVLAIDGRPIAEWVALALPTIGADSSSPEVRMEILGEHFDLYIADLRRHGADSSYTIRLAGQSEKKITAKPLSLKADAALEALPPGKRSSQKAYERLNDATAILRLWDLSQAEDHEEFTGYFRDMREKRIENLIVDLRHDGGGEGETEAFIASFFARADFKLDEYTELRHAGAMYSYEKSINMAPSPGEAYPAMFSDYQKAIGTRFLVKDRSEYKKSEFSFRGKTYLLVNAYTVSAAVGLARFLKDNGAVTVGTETGGGYYSCTAEKFSDIPLGDTGLMLHMPLLKAVFAGPDDAAIPPGRGLIPRYILPPTLSDKLGATDSQLEFCEDLIQNPRGE